jgi:hypothetical protein
MANPNKAKGTRHESAVRDYLNGVLAIAYEVDEVPSWDARHVRRVAQAGVKDVGDLHAYPFVLEAKDTARHDLPGFIAQANEEAHNAGFPFGAAVIKRRGAGVGRSYVCMDLDTFAAVLVKLREGYSGMS